MGQSIWRVPSAAVGLRTVHPQHLVYIFIPVPPTGVRVHRQVRVEAMEHFHLSITLRSVRSSEYLSAPSNRHTSLNNSGLNFLPRSQINLSHTPCRLKICETRAPATVAASWSERGMAPRPFRNMVDVRTRDVDRCHFPWFSGLGLTTRRRGDSAPRF
jgi:hypothetical protein